MLVKNGTCSSPREYEEAINSFFQKYRELQKKNNLKMHIEFSIYDDGLIEIWEQKGREKQYICKIREESDIACFKKAVGILEMHSWKEEDTEHEEKVG